MVTIMGVDPGLAATGIGVISGSGRRIAAYSYGTVTTRSGTEPGRRLSKIHVGVERVLSTETPDAMVVEEAFSLKKYPASAIVLGQVIGVVILAAANAGVPVFRIAVREAKQALTGSGDASKKQLEEAVRHCLGADAPIRPYHASDALGLALVGLNRYLDINNQKGVVSVPSACRPHERS